MAGDTDLFDPFEDHEQKPTSSPTPAPSDETTAQMRVLNAIKDAFK